MVGIKEELAKKAENTKGETKLTKSMSIADLIKAMEPEIRKALPEVITPKRFTRMALSALNTTPKLKECTQMQIISAQVVYENDAFEYELGLNPKLEHRPTLGERGEVRLFYGFFKLVNGGFGFEVMSKTAMDEYAKEYSKAFDSSFSPWKNNYIGMAKKTVIKQALKYAPLKTDFRKALSNDETIKKELLSTMVRNANEEQVTEDEQLSNHAYYYDWRQNRITY